MAYFSFNKVTDPPDDELVNPVTQLNDNFEELDEKLTPFNQNPNTIVDPPIGTEAFVTGNRIAVWDGTAWRLAFNQASTWTAWQALTARAPRVDRPGFPPKARVNSVIRKVELAGGLWYDAAASAWPVGGPDIELFTDASISTSFAPVPGGTSFSQAATSQVSVADKVATANIRIQSVLVPTAHVGVFAAWQGDAGGGNFLTLDGIEWWY